MKNDQAGILYFAESGNFPCVAWGEIIWVSGLASSRHHRW